MKKQSKAVKNCFDKNSDHCIRVARGYGITFHGFRVPKGAMYGYDAKGMFVCVNYKIHAMIRLSKDYYQSYRDEFGNKVSLLVKKGKVSPAINIMRPSRGNDTYTGYWNNNSKHRGDSWKKYLEYGDTTDLILNIFDADESIEIERGKTRAQITKTVPKLIKNEKGQLEIVVTEVATFSNQEVYAASRKYGLRENKQPIKNPPGIKTVNLADSRKY